MSFALLPDALSCAATLVLVFGPLSWLKRAEIKDFWTEAFQSGGNK